jgi:PDDEXK-like domain of unknown function (DUF3799)
MIIYDEPAEKYHAREAVSAGFLWKWVSECPAQAYYESVFNRNPKRPAEKHSNEFDVGTATHLAVLENAEFAEKCSLISYPDYRTRESRELRDGCYAAGKVPLLPKEYEMISAMREAMIRSTAGDYLFSELGRSEVTCSWEIDGVPCKSRADRIYPGTIVDLKTAQSASPQAFQRAMLRDGHHLRAAWYLDGWNLARGNPLEEARRELRGEHGEFIGYEGERITDYLFVVAAKIPPYLVEIYRCDERALAWGRALYQKALREFRRARESGLYSGYSGESGRTITNVLLPAFAENALIAQERAGGFDHDEDDIPY